MEKMKEVLKLEKLKALRAKDKKRNETIIAILAEIQQFEVDNRTSGEAIEATDEKILEILKKMVKSREQAIEIFRKENRKDLVDKDEYQLSVIYEFLPKRYTEEEVMLLIQETINEAEDKSIKNIMQTLVKKIDGKANMKYVNEQVKKLLS